MHNVEDHSVDAGILRMVGVTMVFDSRAFCFGEVHGEVVDGGARLP